MMSARPWRRGMSVAVAPAALHRGLALQRLPSLAEPLMHVAGIGVDHGRVGQRVNVRHTREAAIPVAPEPGGGRHHLVERREVSDADLRNAIDLETNQNAEERYAAHECARAVDGIDEPAWCRRLVSPPNSSPTMA